MTSEFALRVLYGIAALDLIVWVAAFEYLRVLRRGRRERALDACERFALAEVPEGDARVEEFQLAGDARVLAEKLTSQLAKQGLGLFGPVLIDAADDRRIAFRAGGKSGVATIRGLPGIVAEIRFRPGKPGETEVESLVVTSKSDALMIAARIVNAVSLVVTLALFAGLRQYVVDHPNPGVRAQVFQMLQAIHFLWPPFLFAGLSRGGGEAIRGKIRAMIANLPYA